MPRRPPSALAVPSDRLAPLLGLLLLVLAPLLTVGWIGEEVLEQERFAFESPLMLWIHAHTTPGLLHLSTALHVLGGPEVMGPVFVAVTVALWFRRDGSDSNSSRTNHRDEFPSPPSRLFFHSLRSNTSRTALESFEVRLRQRAQAVFALYALGGAVLLNALMKLVFHRPRPELWPRTVIENGASFPSGHSMFAAALWSVAALLLWRTRWRWPALGLGVAYCLLMGSSRLVLGVHYPTDVLAGLLTGLAWVYGAWSLLGHPSGARPAHPGAPAPGQEALAVPADGPLR